MQETDRPRLRPYLQAVQDQNDPYHVYIVDRLGLNGRPLRLELPEFNWLEFFTGEHTIGEIRAAASRQASGMALPLSLFTSLADRLERSILLDGPAYQERIANPVRQPRCIGCYEGDPEKLRDQIRGLFNGKQGAGLPSKPRKAGKLRAALVPHIDFQRGGAMYTWGFKEIFEQSDARLFVVIGTSHYSMHRFTLTRKHFETPLGTVETDQAFIDRLVHHYGAGLFDDELLAHLPEHSIELEVVFLQYLYENRGPIRIVPLVVGAFNDSVEAGRPPRELNDIGRMIKALKQVEAELDEPVCYVISGDLAHIGPKFGERQPLDSATVDHSRTRDQMILEASKSAAADPFFHVIAEEQDRRRICGLPPTYTTLDALGLDHGRVLHYDQYVHPKGFESVSFASVAFYDE